MSRDARLLTIGLISFADDDGRFVGTPAAIRGYVYPFDRLTDHVIQRWLDEIKPSKVVEFYRVEGRDYGHFPHWKDQQSIDRRTPSPLPPPP